MSLFLAFLWMNAMITFLHPSGISSNCHASYRQWAKVTPASLTALSGESCQVVWIWKYPTCEYCPLAFVSFSFGVNNK